MLLHRFNYQNIMGFQNIIGGFILLHFNCDSEVLTEIYIIAIKKSILKVVLVNYVLSMYNLYRNLDNKHHRFKLQLTRRYIASWFVFT